MLTLSILLTRLRIGYGRQIASDEPGADSKMDLLFALILPGIIQLGGYPQQKIFLKIWEGEFECTELMGVECGSVDIFILYTT